MPEEKKRDETDEATQSAAPTVPEEPLDFNALDLTVEKVDERISPSETNVFDK